jgi:hypothetical protein
MTSDIDIFRSANILVKQHGEDAPIHAAMRADAMLEAGDLDGYAAWKRILRRVERTERNLRQRGLTPCPESGPRSWISSCLR